MVAYCFISQEQSYAQCLFSNHHFHVCRRHKFAKNRYEFEPFNIIPIAPGFKSSHQILSSLYAEPRMRDASLMPLI